jgi:hypothetical protein
MCSGGSILAIQESNNLFFLALRLWPSERLSGRQRLKSAYGMSFGDGGPYRWAWWCFGFASRRAAQAGGPHIEAMCMGARRAPSAQGGVKAGQKQAGQKGEGSEGAPPSEGKANAAPPRWPRRRSCGAGHGQGAGEAGTISSDLRQCVSFWKKLVD